MTGKEIIKLASIVVPPDRLRRLRPDKVAELAESIRDRGLIHAITVRPFGRNQHKLVVGWHRLEAVKVLGRTEIEANIIKLSDDNALLVEIDENLIRNELSPAQRAIHLSERKRLYEKAHPQTKHGGDRRSDQVDNFVDLKSFAGDTADKIGKSSRSVQREIARAKRIVDLSSIVDTSLDTGDQLDRLAKLPPAKQRDLIARARAGEDINVRIAEMKDRRIRREQELAEATQAASKALGKKLYGVIYADPPWRYDSPAMGDVARQNEQHYPTMALDDIKAMKVPAADNCVLFLWATMPRLDWAIAVIEAWGFTYKSAVVWAKDKAGTGYWLRGQAELLLIARRGDVPAPAPGEQLPAIIDAPRGRHSEKPDIFADEIVRLFPNVPKLEMFARVPRFDWDAWGNEVSAVEVAPASNVAPVEPNVEADVKALFLQQAQKTQKRHRLTRALKWRSKQR